MVYSICWFPIDTTKTKVKETNQDFFHFWTICTLDFDHSDYITRENFVPTSIIKILIYIVVVCSLILIWYSYHECVWINRYSFFNHSSIISFHFVFILFGFLRLNSIIIWLDLACGFRWSYVKVGILIRIVDCLSHSFLFLLMSKKWKKTMLVEKIKITNFDIQNFIQSKHWIR